MSRSAYTPKEVADDKQKNAKKTPLTTIRVQDHVPYGICSEDIGGVLGVHIEQVGVACSDKTERVLVSPELHAPSWMVRHPRSDVVLIARRHAAVAPHQMDEMRHL